MGVWGLSQDISSVSEKCNHGLHPGHVTQ